MNNDNNFFPSNDYKIPNTSNYMKFQDGVNTFRVLSSAIVGYEYFNNENKPVRSREPFEGILEDAKKGENVKHFWAFLVYNYEAKRIQILQLTQKGIMKTLQDYIKNPKWGNPREYDFIVNRTGSGLDTEYSVTVNPKSPVEAEVVEKQSKLKIDLELLYVGADPFNPEK